MEKTHILKYDGYSVGDRLLEQVIFDVEIIESGETLAVGTIKPSAEAESYLADIRWENFVPAMERDIQWKIDHYVPWVTSQSMTLREALETYTRETGADEIDTLNEV